MRTAPKLTVLHPLLLDPVLPVVLGRTADLPPEGLVLLLAHLAVLTALPVLGLVQQISILHAAMISYVDILLVGRRDYGAAAVYASGTVDIVAPRSISNTHH